MCYHFCTQRVLPGELVTLDRSRWQLPHARGLAATEEGARVGAARQEYPSHVEWRETGAIRMHPDGAVAIKMRAKETMMGCMARNCSCPVPKAPPSEPGTTGRQVRGRVIVAAASSVAGSGPIGEGVPRLVRCFQPSKFWRCFWRGANKRGTASQCPVKAASGGRQQPLGGLRADAVSSKRVSWAAAHEGQGRLTLRVAANNHDQMAKQSMLTCPVVSQATVCPPGSKRPSGSRWFGPGLALQVRLLAYTGDDLAEPLFW